MTDAASLPVRSVLPPGEPISDNEVTVRLLDAGTEPRQVLRYHFAPGLQVRIATTSKARGTVRIGGNPVMQNKTPSGTSVITVRVQSLAPAGDAHCSLRIDEPGPIAALEDMFRIGDTVPALSNLKGLTHDVVVSGRGIVQDTDPPGSPTLEDTVRELLRSFVGSLFVSFPEEAVGPGGRWEVARQDVAVSVLVQTRSVYELVAAQGGRLELRVHSRGESASQIYPNVGVMVEIVAQIVELRGEGSVDLGRLQATWTMATTVTSAQRVHTRKEVLETTTDMTIESRQETLP